MTAAEHDASYPCDALVPPPRLAMTRGVDVAAPASVVWPWLGMLRVAPYSYDWIDNLGRRSPREVDRSLPPLAVGDRLLITLEVTAVDEGFSFTCVSRRAGARAVFATVAMTYAVQPVGPGRSRLLGRMVVCGGTPLRRAANAALALGDLVMMRRQLLNLASLAEATIRSPSDDLSAARHAEPGPARPGGRA